MASFDNLLITLTFLASVAVMRAFARLPSAEGIVA